MTTDAAVHTAPRASSHPTPQADPTEGPMWASNVEAMMRARRRNIDLDLYAKHLGELLPVLDRLGYDVTLVQIQEGAPHPDVLVAELEQRRANLAALRRKRDERRRQRALRTQ